MIDYLFEVFQKEIETKIPEARVFLKGPDHIGIVYTILGRDAKPVAYEYDLHAESIRDMEDCERWAYIIFEDFSYKIGRYIVSGGRL